MLPISLSSVAPNQSKDASSNSPERIVEAAQQFESLLLEQLLRTMREASGGGWMGAGDDQSSQSLMEYAEQEFARVMAAGGGFGLARMVADGLATKDKNAAEAAP